VTDSDWQTVECYVVVDGGGMGSFSEGAIFTELGVARLDSANVCLSFLFVVIMNRLQYTN
jgi:hypothetical protein